MRKDPDTRIKSEPALAYAAFVCYKNNRNLTEAYNVFMQENPEALTSMKAFVKWASVYNWQRRVNEYDSQQEMFTRQETRRMGIENSLTSEKMAQELFATVKDEIELKKGEMTHNDMARYLNICVKINEKWIKQPDASPVVNVNVDNNISQTVKTEPIDPEIAQAVGKLLALKESKQVDEDD